MAGTLFKSTGHNYLLLFTHSPLSKILPHPQGLGFQIRFRSLPFYSPLKLNSFDLPYKNKYTPICL